jgi:hypothetical protein
MKELSAKALIDRKCMTVEGRKVGDLLKGVEVLTTAPRLIPVHIGEGWTCIYGTLP